MKQILLFGGTFDPPHVGHLTMAQLALEQTDTDQVWFLPAPMPPHKMGEKHLEYPFRVEMTRALIQGYPRLSVSTIEASLEGPSYTIDTIMACKRKYPDYHFRFLLGSDSLADLPTWHEALRLSREIDFVVADRSSHVFGPTLLETQRALPKLQVDLLEMPILDISSRWLRIRLEAGEPVCGLVPERVLEIWQRQFSGRL